MTIRFDNFIRRTLLVSFLLPSFCQDNTASVKQHRIRKRERRREKTVTPSKYTRKRSDLPPSFNNATRLTANYASSPPARPALMTYRRQDSFVTTPQHDTTRTDTLVAKHCIQYSECYTLHSRSMEDPHEFEYLSGLLEK